MRTVASVLALFLFVSCATTKKSGGSAEPPVAQQQPPPPPAQPATPPPPPPPPRQPTTAELLAAERFVLVIDGFNRGSAVPPAGTASVVADANNRIAKIAAIAAKDTKTPKPVVRVVGHCDRTGSEAFNQTLSVQRARAVAGRLRATGVQLKVEGRGFNELADPSDPGSARNRRVEIRFD